MASKIYECIEKIGNRIIEEKEFLTELDREIGDADHGINMARGFTEVLGVLPKDSDNIGELLKKTGEDGKAIFEAVIAGIQKRGKAVKGEKTMLDAIIPASEAYTAAIDGGASLPDALDAMCKAAEEGVEFTKTIIATKGRASYLGERSIGHQDPGATSATYTLECIRDFVKGM